MNLSPTGRKDDPPVQPYVSPKRSACDRCRGQKQRCPPRRQITDPCGRCSRLGARCVTSNIRARIDVPNDAMADQWSYINAVVPGQRVLGCKPPHPPPQSHPDPDPDSTKATIHKNPPRFKRPLHDHAHLPSTAKIVPFPDYSQPDLNGCLQLDLAEHGTGEGSYQHVLSNAANAHNFDIFDVDDVASMLSGSNPPDMSSVHQAPSTDSNETGPPRGDSEIESASAEDIVFTPSTLPHSTPSITPTVTMVDGRLAALHFKTAESLSNCTSAGDNVRLCWRPELFGDTLKDSSHFLEILQSFGSSGGVGIHVGLAVTLTIINVYIQLVSLFYRYLQPLAEQLSRGPDSTEVQILPGLQLGGFQVRQNRAQAQLVLEVMLDHFAAMERILELPHDLCVTSRNNSKPEAGSSDQGIFRGDLRACAVLNAISSHISLHDDGSQDALILLRKIIGDIQRYSGT